MAIYSLGQWVPTLDETAFVADTASVIGQVTLGQDTSVWPRAVLRADNEPIQIGPGSSVQEGAVLHTDPGYPLVVGAGVTIRERSMLHGCTIGDGSLIGDRAVVMNGAIIGRHCLVAAGALITEGKIFPDNSLIRGAPAQAVGPLSDADVLQLSESAQDAVARARRARSAPIRRV